MDKFGLLFIPTYGHTDYLAEKDRKGIKDKWTETCQDASDGSFGGGEFINGQI